MFKGVVTFALLIMFSVTGSDAVASGKLTFSTFPGSGMSRVVAEVLDEAYATLDISIDIVELPAQRALQLADDGEFDGEAGRLAAIERSTNNLLRVPVPVFEMTAYVYTKNADFTVEGYESLRPYRIGILRGYKHAERMVADMDHVVVPEFGQLFAMLESDRVDVVVLNELDAREALADSGLTDIRALQPPINKAPLYHYLHAKHADLVPRISEALEAMERAGRIAEIANGWEPAKPD